MYYFTNASTEGRVQYHQLPGTIGVNGSPTIFQPIGTASAVGRTADGRALWSLWVDNTDVPGRFVIVDGQFMPITPALN